MVIGLGTSIAGIINHVIAWKWFYISLFIIGAYGEGIVRWQPNGQREYDAINTEFVQPQYNAVVINIGNALRIAYDASWCWYNTYVVGYRDIPKALALFFFPFSDSCLRNCFSRPSSAPGPTCSRSQTACPWPLLLHF